jgi:hypothetical protein
VKKRTRKIQIRPSGSGFHLLASRHDTTRSRQDLQLLPRLQPAPLLHHLRAASPPARASDWPGAERTTLKGRRREPSRGERREEKVADTPKMYSNSSLSCRYVSRLRWTTQKTHSLKQLQSSVKDRWGGVGRPYIGKKSADQIDDLAFGDFNH